MQAYSNLANQSDDHSQIVLEMDKTTSHVKKSRLRCILFFTLPLASVPFCVSPPRKRRFVLRARPSSDVQPVENGDVGSSFGLYVHIPYCRRRCNYCDFAIVPIGSTNGAHRRSVGFEDMDANYKKALLEEVRAIGKGSTGKIRLGSIYFGGGTPSLAPISTLRGVMHALLEPENAPFYLDSRAEITIEMDPGTFDLEYLVAVKDMGFNRISLGVQSFDDNILLTMGRVHRAVDVHRSIGIIGEVFGEDANYSIDLMSGVPGLTLAGWSETLHHATRLRPRPLHMSVYDLQVEQGTTFGKWYGDTESGKAFDAPRSDSAPRPALPTAEDSAFMYSYASGYLHSRNYSHYEISSYAYKSHRSKHNQVYWQYGGQWYALGLGSTSNINGVRFARPRALSDYIAWVKELHQKFTDSLPHPQVDNVRQFPWLHRESQTSDDPTHEDESILDVVMTRLRTSEGLDLDWVSENHERGEIYVEKILRGFQLALDLDLGIRDNVMHGKHGRIRLNDPSGFLYSNNIISNVFVELSELGL